MLPAVASLQRTTTEILAYTAVTVALSIVLAPVAHLGALYLVVAALAGVGFLGMAARLWRLARADRATGRDAMRLFAYSITYLTVLFVAMAADVLLRHYA
jgi:protoheme IX farnesyltransferase